MKKVIAFCVMFSLGCVHYPDYSILGTSEEIPAFEKHVRSASRIVVGTVVEENARLHDYDANCYFKAGSLLRFGSDTNYYFVVISVDNGGFLKGKKEKSGLVELVGVVSDNGYENWNQAPQFEIKQRGVWILHNYNFKLQGTCGRSYLPDDRNYLTVRDVFDYQPIERLEEIKYILSKH